MVGAHDCGFAWAHVTLPNTGITWHSAWMCYVAFVFLEMSKRPESALLEPLKIGQNWRNMYFSIVFFLTYCQGTPLNEVGKEDGFESPLAKESPGFQPSGSCAPVQCACFSLPAAKATAQKD